MHKILVKSAPSMCLPKLPKPFHSYPTRLSPLNYVKPTPKLNKYKYKYFLQRTIYLEYFAQLHG